MNKRNQKHALFIHNKKLWALYLSYHFNWWVTFKFWCTIRKSIISHKNLHNRSYSIYWFFFFRTLIVMITVLVAIVYRCRRGKKFCISISYFLYMYMYQHAYLDEVSNVKVILRLGIWFRSLEQFFKEYFALLWFVILCTEHNNIR